MSKDSLMHIWERVRNEIRRLRGINRFRGTDLHLLPKKQVRLQAEMRGNGAVRGEYVIHLSDAESEVWLEEMPGSRHWGMEEFDMDLEALVRHAVDLCRGEDYLHTFPCWLKSRKSPRNGV